VFRQTTPPIVQTQIRSELEDLERAESDLDREIEQAPDESTRAALEAERDAVRDEGAAVREVMKARKDQLEQGWRERIAAIRAKLKSAAPAVRARHEAHLRRMSRFLEEQDEAVQRLLG
jgi:vacuolar-type H+-ATPase subunit H